MKDPTPVEVELFNSICEDEWLREWNEYQEFVFKNGGIAMPKFKKYKDALKFVEIANELFAPCTRKFRQDSNETPELNFRLPPRFTKD